jgi:hypothetical protein
VAISGATRAMEGVQLCYLIQLIIERKIGFIKLYYCLITYFIAENQSNFLSFHVQIKMEYKHIHTTLDSKL